MKTCDKCNKSTNYSEEYDAYFCEGCDVWLEPKCSHEGCEFCEGRPEKPPVEPQRNYSNERITDYFCGNCLTDVWRHYKFCPECSRKINWEE